MVDFLRESTAVTPKQAIFELGLTDWTIPNQEGGGAKRRLAAVKKSCEWIIYRVTRLMRYGITNSKDEC